MDSWHSLTRQPSQSVVSRFSKRACISNIRKRACRRYLTLFSGVYQNIYERANTYRHKQTDTQGRILGGLDKDKIAMELIYHETRKGKHLMVRKGWIRGGKKKGVHCRGKPEQSIMKCIFTICNFTVKPICLYMYQQLKEEEVKRSYFIHLFSLESVVGWRY